MRSAISFLASTEPDVDFPLWTPLLTGTMASPFILMFSSFLRYYGVIKPLDFST
jgi:hypothetical protein